MANNRPLIGASRFYEYWRIVGLETPAGVEVDAPPQGNNSGCAI
jgi:hypothetical protein